MFCGNILVLVFIFSFPSCINSCQINITVKARRTGSSPSADYSNFRQRSMQTATSQHDHRRRRYGDFQLIQHEHFETPYQTLVPIVDKLAINTVKNHARLHYKRSKFHHVKHDRSETFYTAADGSRLVNGHHNHRHHHQASGLIGSRALFNNQNETGAIIALNFPEDFNLFDPRKSSSAFEFGKISNTNTLLDGFGFDTTSENVVRMLTMPFRTWSNNTEAETVAAENSGTEAAIVTKIPVMIDAQQTLGAALKFYCHTMNTERHNFGLRGVVNANDDPRLARCGFFFRSKTSTNDDETNELEFGITATNEGVWAVYSFYRRSTTTPIRYGFDIYRRLASRQHSKQLIDARVEVGAHEARYYLGGQLQWKIGDFGIPAPALLADKRNRLVSINADSSPQIVTPTSFTFLLSTSHKMDVGDALNGNDSSNVALVKYSQQANFYSPNVKFIDDVNLRNSSIFGQGAEFGIARLVIKRLNIIGLAKRTI